MKKKLRIVLAQLNLTVGDIDGNLQKYIKAAKQARDDMAADVIVFPELGLTGYPAEDLLLRKAFIEEEQAALKHFTNEISGIYCVVGHTQPLENGLQNSCSLIYNGFIISHYAKQHLPNYGVFDECRYFTPDNKTCVAPIHGILSGLVICEDLWKSEPTQQAAKQGAQIILSPNASPFETDKHERRVAILAARAKENRTPIVYVNQVGGQDEIVFDGGSMVIDANGNIAQFAGFFNETLLSVDMDFTQEEVQITTAAFSLPSKSEKIYQALVLSVRDYFHKNRITHAILGLSGGIDSALVLAIAVDALGKDRVRAVIMPSRYTSSISIEDAIQIANHLHVKYDSISIEPIYQSLLNTLQPFFEGKAPDVTEENLQARARGIILMALSNKFGSLVLTTGNRSELAVGYCTLYGDMAGGFAPIKDIPKTLVYSLAEYRNQVEAIIPKRVFERPPTAELAPNQTDQDTLPPYAILDDILERYLNQGQSINEITAAGFNQEIVTRVTSLIRKNEYKRKQSAIGPRINKTSFGKDWRYPITNGFKG